MKKILLVGTVLLMAACGSSKSGVSVSTSGDKASNTSAPGGGSGSTSDSTGDTIPVKSLSDIPPECISLLGDFLKQIEPIVSKVDWSKATVAQLEDLGNQFTDESDKFNTEAAAKGCDKYDLQTSDANTLKQLEALAKTVAPGTVGFIHFIGTFSAASTQTTVATAAGDCDSVIAQIEPYLKSGKTIKDLTIAEVTKVSNLFTQVGTSCPPDKANAFFLRADVQAFAGG